MPEYEIIIESMTPCGGSKYANRTIIEAEAESPEAYVEQHKRFPIRDISKTADGNVVITTGNESGYIDRYTFSESSRQYKRTRKCSVRLSCFFHVPNNRG